MVRRIDPIGGRPAPAPGGPDLDAGEAQALAARDESTAGWAGSTSACGAGAADIDAGAAAAGDTDGKNGDDRS